jgi:hypothetical protein
MISLTIDDAFIFKTGTYRFKDKDCPYKIYGIVLQNDDLLISIPDDFAISII